MQISVAVTFLKSMNVLKRASGGSSSQKRLISLFELRKWPTLRTTPQKEILSDGGWKVGNSCVD